MNDYLVSLMSKIIVYLLELVLRFLMKKFFEYIIVCLNKKKQTSK